MADGKWRLIRKGRAGTVEIDEIRVWWNNETWDVIPNAFAHPHALVLEWPDGKEDHYPWASILKAEYTPPTNNPA